MSNEILRLATEIVISMINTGHIERDTNSNQVTSEAVCKAIDKVAKQLETLSNSAMQ